MSIKRSPTKQASGISRQSSGTAFKKRTKIKSRSAAKSKSIGIFRSDLLEYNPIEKSGYSSLKIDLPEEEQFDRKVMLATEWLKCLKQHENYKQILVDSESTIDIVFQLLHTETERLFKNFNWMLHIEADEEPRLIYYESLGDVSNYNVPLDWLYDNKDLVIRNASLWLIKQLSVHFGIEIITNDTIEMCYDNWQFEEDDDWSVVNYVREQLDNGDPSDKLLIYEAVTNIYSYKYGKPKELKELLRDMMWTYEEGYYKKVVNEHLADDIEFQDWLLSGYELLKNECVDIENFNLVPEDLKLDNGEPVTIHHSIFFPYSFEGFVFDEYENWINDIAQGIGTNDIINWGYLSANKHAKPSNKEPLLALIKFLEKGRELYFKRNEH